MSKWEPAVVLFCANFISGGSAHPSHLFAWSSFCAHYVDSSHRDFVLSEDIRMEATKKTPEATVLIGK